MPSDRLTARIPATPETRDDLAAVRDATGAGDYDALLRAMLEQMGQPSDSEEGSA